MIQGPSPGVKFQALPCPRDGYTVIPPCKIKKQQLTVGKSRFLVLAIFFGGGGVVGVVGSATLYSLVLCGSTFFFLFFSLFFFSLFSSIDTDHAWLSYSKVHPTSTRWSCKNRADLQSPFVISLSNNTRISFPGRQVGTQDKTTSFSSSGDGWAALKNIAQGDTIVEDRAMFLRKRSFGFFSLVHNTSKSSCSPVVLLLLLLFVSHFVSMVARHEYSFFFIVFDPLSLTHTHSLSLSLSHLFLLSLSSLSLFSLFSLHRSLIA